MRRPGPCSGSNGPARHRLRALVLTALVLATTAAGCAKSTLVRDVLGPGQEVAIQIDAADGVDTWSVRTASEQDVVVLRLTGEPVAVGWLKIRVLLPGGVVAAEILPPPGGPFAFALSGRAAEWTIELRLAERGSAPVSYAMAVGRPSAAASGARSACADALRALGVNAWVVSVARLPGGAGLAFPGLGTIAFRATPAGAATIASPGAGAPPVPHLRGGTVLEGDFAGLGCDPRQLQLNLWDTGKGAPPVLSIFDASGRPLCGGAGQLACPVNPSPGRWVTWTLLAPAPIHRFSLKGDELFLSSIVIQ